MLKSKRKKPSREIHAPNRGRKKKTVQPLNLTHELRMTQQRAGTSTQPSLWKSSSNSTKRSREEIEISNILDGELCPEIAGTSSRRTQQRAYAVNDRLSVGTLRDASSDDDTSEVDRATPARLSIEELSIITHSATHDDFKSGYRKEQSQIQEMRTSRTSLPSSSHGGETLLTSRLMSDALLSTTTSEFGIDVADMISHPSMDPTIIYSTCLSASIIFKLRIPRLKMERHIRVEDNEQNADELYKEITRYFHRYDRLIGTPVLECVVEDEADCRCIYNVTELRYFIEELRERQRIIKVTVTQST